MVDWSILIQEWGQQIIDYLPKLAGTLALLVIGWVLINILLRWVSGLMKKRKVDKSLRPFIRTLMKWVLRVLLLISVASTLGIHMTSFVAIIGAAGLALGLALQGSLSNFAGGVLILLFKPFEVDEYIDAQEVSGTVTEIRVFHTTLLTPDNIYITIPNGELSNHVIKNYSRMPTRRHDLTFGIGYDDDIDKARKSLMALINKDKRIQKDPVPVIYVDEHGDSSVKLLARFWTKKEDYWDVHFDFLESVKKRFDKDDIGIPYPQMDVYLKKSD